MYGILFIRILKSKHVAPHRRQMIYALISILNLWAACIDDYKQQSKETAFKGIKGGEEKQNQVVKQLKTIQRVFRVTPKYEDIKTLLKEGLDSAYIIAKKPRATFVNNYGKYLGGQERAAEIYETSVKLATAGMGKNRYRSLEREHRQLRRRRRGETRIRTKTITR
jgi:hypothetical protein